MTNKQKEELAFHVTFYGPKKGQKGAELFYLTNGEEVRFTNVSYTAKNAVYEINNQTFRKIWFSQLNEIHFSKDLEEILESIIKFKDGSIKTLSEFDEITFYETVKQRTFIVDVINDYPYIFNHKSNVWIEADLISYMDAYNYINNCIEEDRIKDIKDLIKTANLYNFREI